MPDPEKPPVDEKDDQKKPATRPIRETTAFTGTPQPTKDKPVSVPLRG